MKYVEIDLGCNGNAMICFENIIALEMLSNGIKIEYPTKLIRLTCASVERTTKMDEVLINQAYDKIKKILEKL